MHYPKLSPSNEYVDIDGVPAPVEELAEPAAKPVEKPEGKQAPSPSTKHPEESL